jgi:acetyl/propionyl-CoA carboxylase alpha subunit
MRVLVANRGEIACRILRTLRALGVPSVAVFTPPDRQSPHVWLADSAHALKGPKDYLDGAQLIAVAQRARATAIHPGYGFLSQNDAFAQAVRAAGLIFIGPQAHAMQTLGDKRAARALAERLDIAVVPGAQSVRDDAEAAACAQAVGFPLLLKAAGGGGGRGMRRLEDGQNLSAHIASARREAQQHFNDPGLLMERYIHPARHIEVQILGDGARTVVLGERECSLQRRYQKVLEEGPVTHLSAPQRQALYAAATRLGEATSYSGAGTVEFLLGPDGALYFLEVNTRLQVEHPVTEMCTGLDLVALQLQVADGQKLRDFKPPTARGHAVEVRLNAENAAERFVPQTGTVSLVSWPTGPNVRVDAGVAEGTVVGADYDPLLAKIIAWGPSRQHALGTLRGAIDELALLGVGHNQAFLAALLATPMVAEQQTFTTSVEAQPWPAPPVPAYLRETLGPGSAEASPQPGARRSVPGPWQHLDGFRSI